MSEKRSLIAAIFATSSLLFGMPASAVLITGNGSSLVNFSFASLQGGVTLSGSVNIDVSNFNSTTNTATLTVTLSNTTPGSTTGDNRWTGWGFGIAPNVASNGATFSDVADGGMTLVDTSQLPGLGLIEVCTGSGAQNCAGGGGNGILEASSDTFDIALSFSSSIANGFDLSPFGVKFQAVGAGGQSYEFYTNCTSSTGCNPPPVCPVGTVGTPPNCIPGGSTPEPASLALVGLGLAGLGLVRRRKR